LGTGDGCFTACSCFYTKKSILAGGWVERVVISLGTASKSKR